MWRRPKPSWGREREVEEEEEEAVEEVEGEEEEERRGATAGGNLQTKPLGPDSSSV